MVRKEEFYNLHAELCKAIFNPKRLAILDALRHTRMNVGDLSIELKTSQSNISQHLGILKDKGLVRSVIEGNNTFYSISSDKILLAFDLVSEIIMDKFKDENKLLRE